MSKPSASEQVQVNFRMPADLKARIEERAKAKRRSTTAEIVATLEEKYPPPSPYHLLREEIYSVIEAIQKSGPGSQEVSDSIEHLSAVLSSVPEDEANAIAFFIASELLKRPPTAD
ncbi:Arc family DNA-binding protein [Paracoccus sp. (in: a-proteobacteria)]|uniref:Arc family DNA-binding protein n=1 Tax=Paracoccus sp. TaxID=267 RepID=UPI002AFF3630|nr:Arc family DNA-binding protein [Paracoccus sp. (in: a-proteobacteria)]